MHESELFPVNMSIIMGQVEDYLQMPRRMRAIEAKTAAEDIVRDGSSVGTKRNFIGLLALLLHYFAGRELLIELGDLDVASDLENNIWGTAWFDPHDYLKQLAKVRFYIADSGTLRPLTIAELEPLTATVRKSHKELYVRYAQMSRKERAVCATKVYAWKLKSWARAAGAFEEIRWELSPRVLQMYDLVSDNDYALDLLGRVFVPPERESVFRPIE